MAGRGVWPQHGDVLPASPIICLVDDDSSVLRSLGRLLTFGGYEVLLFRDPADFIKHATSHRVALVVLDCIMPGLSGMQVQECLRTLSPDTRVIMMSAVCDRDLRHMVMAAGARAFFEKPFHEAEFLAAVQEALRCDVLGAASLPGNAAALPAG